MKTTLLLFSFIICVQISAQTTFIDQASHANVDIGGNKDGGVSFGDFNNDGCIDLMVNTSDGTNRSRLYMNNCDGPDPTFTDVTSTHAPVLLDRTMDRSMVWGDYNNDGYLDFARNVSWRIEIYINQGPSGDPAWSFGNADHTASYATQTMDGGFNTEGLAWFDYNGDGFLDLIVENHNYGIDILRNPADCTSNFFQITPNSSPLGLPNWAGDGDYMATSDYNDDGWVDILARKRDQNDVWRNDGGTFTNIQNIDQATNGNKGAVVWADFDNDGDFDLFWSANGTNQIWQQTGLNSGSFVATGEPSASSGITLGTGIDACAAQDIDNDGDIDLLAVDDSGDSYLFVNQSSATAWSFTRNNGNIDINGDGEGAVFGDYDNDGDQDLYVNKRGGNNQLWQNQLNNSNYLYVNPRLDLGADFTRSDHGATVILYNADGSQIKGGIRDARSSFGHGNLASDLIHFGLPDGPNATYQVE
ncbi:MAG: VCBS repeat-containing protein, partial [Flavobacteriales bacterium]|nr:VCBS repeat-containing protein [Flavobacteriales bacterium]